ncbi:MAG: HDIG domain-containing protein [Phycisphaeraceae bacterium]|nr:HDIG domain-containing protein [Phycisphaeraceae bacterium]
MAKNPAPSRRRDIRRGLPAQSPQWIRVLLSPRILWSCLFVGMFAAIASWAAIEMREYSSWQLGDTLQEPAVARVGFRAVDEQRTLALAEQRRREEPSVYVHNAALVQTLTELADELHRLCVGPEAKPFDGLAPEVTQRLRLRSAGYDELQKAVGEVRQAEWPGKVRQFVEGLLRLPIVSASRIEDERPGERPEARIVVLDAEGRQIEEFRLRQLLNVTGDIGPMQQRVAELANQHFRHAAIADYFTQLVIDLRQPMLRYDPDRTEARRQAVFAQVMEEGQEFVEIQDGQVIAAAGQPLDRATIIKLREESRIYRESLGRGKLLVSHLTLAGIILTIVAGMWLYAGRYSPRVIENPLRGFSLAGIMLLTYLAAVIGAGVRPSELMVVGVFPTLMATLLLAIVYDQRFALAAGAMHAMLVTVSLGQSTGFLLVLLVGAAVAVHQMDELRTRSKLVAVGFWTGLAVALAVALTGLVERPLHLPGQFREIGLDIILGFGTALATGIVVQAMLPMIERIFQVTTAMTLKELQDASHPLLRQLADVASGTYQHSLRIADLAESAAQAIGANSLLCKVGALYHDIGKMNKPAYFIENQTAGINRHDRLSPAMSLLIIIGHVKDGVEMAREFGLPRPIRHFIESHHGTTLVEYFYNQAKQQKTAEGERASQPSDHDFRYPGPKPETREAAIMMLCDAIESASRTLSDPAPSRLETLVHSIAQKRLADGQFDECNLTLKELHAIEQAIHKSLCAIYHGRIAYPGGASESKPNEETAVMDAKPSGTSQVAS